MNRVFVTGGSGLLGSQVVATFRDAGWDVLAPSHAELELTDFSALRVYVSAQRPALIINCAAQRKPDLCESTSPEVLALNVALPEQLARFGIPLVHISTDYVFNGANAPYEVDARRAPINAYGRQKAAAEVALEAYDHTLTLRLPILFGPTRDLRNSAVTVLAANLCAAAGKPVLMDDLAIRYPTYTPDIARQLLRLAPIAGKSLTGVIHYSAEEAMTKYLMALTMAPLIGCAPTQCLPDTRPPAVPRPYDCHLSTKRLRRLGLFVEPTPFATAITALLKHAPSRTS